MFLRNGRAILAKKRENHMAERKPSLTRAPARPELERLLKLNRENGVSEATIQEQRASFAYGNAPKGSRITKDSARSASKSIRLQA
jgi:hypothetical protein